MREWMSQKCLSVSVSKHNGFPVRTGVHVAIGFSKANYMLTCTLLTRLCLSNDITSTPKTMCFSSFKIYPSITRRMKSVHGQIQKICTGRRGPQKLGALRRGVASKCPLSTGTLVWWPWEWHAVFGKLLSWALSQWCITPDSLVYTLPQKKGNFKNVAFLVEKSVSWSCFAFNHNWFAKLHEGWSQWSGS